MSFSLFSDQQLDPKGFKDREAKRLIQEAKELQWELEEAMEERCRPLCDTAFRGCGVFVDDYDAVMVVHHGSTEDRYCRIAWEAAEREISESYATPRAEIFWLFGDDVHEGHMVPACEEILRDTKELEESEGITVLVIDTDRDTTQDKPRMRVYDQHEGVLWHHWSPFDTWTDDDLVLYPVSSDTPEEEEKLRLLAHAIDKAEKPERPPLPPRLTGTERPGKMREPVVEPVKAAPRLAYEECERCGAVAHAQRPTLASVSVPACFFCNEITAKQWKGITHQRRVIDHKAVCGRGRNMPEHSGPVGVTCKSCLRMNTPEEGMLREWYAPQTPPCSNCRSDMGDEAAYHKGHEMWLCDRCEHDLDGFEERRARTKAKQKAQAEPKKKVTPTFSGVSGVKVHLKRPDRNSGTAACGVHPERSTDDPDEVTCKKCGPAAKKRKSRPLPTCSNCKTQTYDPEVGDHCGDCVVTLRFEREQHWEYPEGSGLAACSSKTGVIKEYGVSADCGYCKQKLDEVRKEKSDAYKAKVIAKANEGKRKLPFIKTCESGCTNSSPVVSRWDVEEGVYRDLCKPCASGTFHGLPRFTKSCLNDIEEAIYAQAIARDLEEQDEVTPKKKSKRKTKKKPTVADLVNSVDDDSTDESWT